MKFTSADCYQVKGDSVYDIWDHPPGAFLWLEETVGRTAYKSLAIMMPYHADNYRPLHQLLVYRKGEAKPPSPSWEWDGDEDHPTLAPSIGCGRNCERWHGYLKKGRLEACE